MLVYKYNQEGENMLKKYNIGQGHWYMKMLRTSVQLKI